MKLHILLFGILVVGFSQMLSAQGVGASGDIKGTIKDASGAVMPNVAIAILQTDKGTRYTASTDSTGQYHAIGLAPGSYDISAAMPGFESQMHKAVQLNLGDTVIVDFRMSVSAKSETVEVPSGLAIVDTERGSQARIMEQPSIRELPIDRRDYLTFTLLTPGVSDSKLRNREQYCRRELCSAIQCPWDGCLAEPASGLHRGVAETGNSIRSPNRFLNCCGKALNFATQACARSRENEDLYASGQTAAIP
jgi:hypothetical protein